MWAEVTGRLLEAFPFCHVVKQAHGARVASHFLVCRERKTDSGQHDQTARKTQVERAAASRSW